MKQYLIAYELSNGKKSSFKSCGSNDFEAIGKLIVYCLNGRFARILHIELLTEEN